MNSHEHFMKWGLGFSGCDGGDIGSKQSPAVWVCGLEWGGGHDIEELKRQMHDTVEVPPSGYDSWETNLSYIFNWQVMKLLAAMNGLQVSEYKRFAEKEAPFTEGTKGYFKMNLYPISFRNTSPQLWQDGFSEITGFTSKNEYISWANQYRLPEICKWAKDYGPGIVICLGKNYRFEFGTAFDVSTDQWNREEIDGKEISWAINSNGTLVVVLPFMVNRNGLVLNASIQKVGERIAQIRAGNMVAKNPWSESLQQATREAIDSLPFTPDNCLHFKCTDGRFALIHLSDLAHDDLVLRIKNSDQPLQFASVEALLEAGWAID